MGTTYQQLFMNGINKVISSLLAGSQPDSDPGKTAWSWLGTSGGAEPSEVNSYVSGQIGAGTVTTSTFTPTNNWASWSNALNNTLSAATGTVANWLGKTYAATAADLPTVPDDVITWTKQNLPTQIGAVMMANRAATRAGRA